MNKIKLLIGALGAVCSMQLNAGLITTTVGNLTYTDEDTVAGDERIKGDGFTYVGLGTLKDLNYIQILDLINPDAATDAAAEAAATAAAAIAGISDASQFQGFTIANQTQAQTFVKSLYGGVDNACTAGGLAPGFFDPNCGSLGDWFDGAFGDNSGLGIDFALFESDYVAEPPSTALLAGIIGLNHNDSSSPSRFADFEISPSFTTVATSSFVSIEDVLGDASWLLVKQDSPAPAPEPGILALFGAGMLGLGFARRRQRR